MNQENSEQQPEGQSIIDYKELLKKYMREVIDCEGVSFIGGARSKKVIASFSEAETAELLRMEKEIDNE